METKFSDRLIKVVRIKSRDPEAVTGSHPGDCEGHVLLLDPLTVFSTNDGDWYGNMYLERGSEDGEYSSIGVRKLSRYACCPAEFNL